MSLLEWSTPERRNADRILSVIPNEIYIYIFEHIAPPSGRLDTEEARIFADLSGVCRFFADFCLPRIFEYLVFSGSIFSGIPRSAFFGDTIYDRSREARLFSLINVRQPLALALAKQVRTCHFTDWNFDATGSWEVRLMVKNAIAGTLHMTNIREIKFWGSFVDADYWDVIASLDSLEHLCFDWCYFLQDPVNVDIEERAKIKVSHLQVTDCLGYLKLVGAVEARYLRTLTMDIVHFEHTDWLLESGLTELQIRIGRPVPSWQQEVERIHAVLAQIPRTVEDLTIYVDLSHGPAETIFQTIFDTPVWVNLPLVRSLTLQVFHDPTGANRPANILSMTLDGISCLTGPQSCMLKSYADVPEISSLNARHILHDKVGPGSSLAYMEIFGKALTLVDGEWSEIKASAT